MRMTRLALLVWVAPILTWSYSTAGAECAYPQAPASVPDGKNASEAEMLRAMTLFKKYDADVNAYVACLDEETKARVQAGGGSSQLFQFKSLQLRKQNAAVDGLRNEAQKFNEQVRAYKGRG